jgi:hypothetical protein
MSISGEVQLAKHVVSIASGQSWIAIHRHERVAFKVIVSFVHFPLFPFPSLYETQKEDSGTTS